jgi:hypothetical protein
MKHLIELSYGAAPGLTRAMEGDDLLAESKYPLRDSARRLIERGAGPFDLVEARRAGRFVAFGPVATMAR